MAFLDFNKSIGESTGLWIGGDDGSQQINSALPNPLLLQGADCRIFSPAPNVLNSLRRHVRFTLDSAAHPSFTGIPNTQAISIRAWVRKETGYNYSNGGVANGVYLHVKGDSVFGNNGNNGYTLIYGNDVSGIVSGYYYPSISMRLRNDTAGPPHDIGMIDVAGDTWHHIRLDVIPTKNGAVVDRDTVRAYISTLADEANPVWTLLHEEVVLLSQPYAASWGLPSTRVGFGVMTTSNLNPAYSKAIYIDGFDVRVANV